jgi:hypothetical protein
LKVQWDDRPEMARPEMRSIRLKKFVFSTIGLGD